MSYESCVLNDYKGFSSLQNCYDIIKCASGKVSFIIKKQDLKELNKKVKANESLEGSLSVYSTEAYNSCINPLGIN